MDTASRFAPELRTSTVNILTPLGWLQGGFHIPKLQSLLDFLAPGVTIIKCSRVRVPGESKTLAFLGLQRDAVHLIEPTQADEHIESPGAIGRTTARQVACLLPAGVLRGDLEVLVNVRVSDFLRQQQGMFVVRNAVLTPYGAEAGASASASTSASAARKFRTVILNPGAAVGVSEPEGTGN
jgi:hypothetical protein